MGEAEGALNAHFPTHGCAIQRTGMPGARPPCMAARFRILDDDELVDEASRQSFPSSDPPAFTPVMGVNRGRAECRRNAPFVAKRASHSGGSRTRTEDA